MRMKDKTVVRLVLLVTFVILFFMALYARADTINHPVAEEVCAILREELTARGTTLQWCCLDDDGHAELVQEVIDEYGTRYYLDFFGPGSKRLGTIPRAD